MTRTRWHGEEQKSQCEKQSVTTACESVLLPHLVLLDLWPTSAAQGQLCELYPSLSEKEADEILPEGQAKAPRAIWEIVWVQIDLIHSWFNRYQMNPNDTKTSQDLSLGGTLQPSNLLVWSLWIFPKGLHKISRISETVMIASLVRFTFPTLHTLCMLSWSCRTICRRLCQTGSNASFSMSCCIIL